MFGDDRWAKYRAAGYQQLQRLALQLTWTRVHNISAFIGGL
jgi:hypothetical protein